MTETMFVKVFGGSPMVKIMDVLIENRMFDLSKVELSEMSKVSRMTLNKLFPILVKNKIVVNTRQIGRASLYKLNMASPIAQELVRIDKVISDPTDKVEEKMVMD